MALFLKREGGKKGLILPNMPYIDKLIQAFVHEKGLASGPPSWTSVVWLAQHNFSLGNCLLHPHGYPRNHCSYIILPSAITGPGVGTCLKMGQ